MKRMIDAIMNTCWDEILEDGDNRLKYFCLGVALTAVIYFGAACLTALLRGWGGQ